MRRVLPVVLVGILLAGGWWLTRRGPHLSEEDRVHETLEEARQAVETRDLARFMACISPRYDDGNHTYESLRATMAVGLREYRRVRVVVYVREIRVQGDTAVATVDVQAEGEHRSGGPARYQGPIEVRLAREQARRYLVFSEPRWRATGMDVFSDIQDAFSQ